MRPDRSKWFRMDPIEQMGIHHATRLLVKDWCPYERPVLETDQADWISTAAVLKPVYID